MDSRTSSGAASTAPTMTADVLIVGAGLVGGALACGLAQSGLKVVAVDRDEPAKATSLAFDGRTCAVSLSSRRLLDAVGVWRDVAADAGPILDIRVADGDSPLFLHYDHTEVGGDPFGWIVENAVVRRSIRARIDALDEAVLLSSVHVVDLKAETDGVHAVLSDGRRVHARLAVAADGRTSTTRANARIGITRWDYRQTAIVCTVAHRFPHDGVAHEHFLPSGPFAMLPMTGNRSSVVWTEGTRRAEAIMALDAAGFLAELKHRFGDFLGDIEVVGRTWAYPLSLQFADSYVGHRLALAGDAAHGMHPIAGQGVNMGFRDVAALTEVVVEASRLGFDIGDSAVLAGYQRWRRFDNLTMLMLTDGLTRLFSNDRPLLRLGRDLGLAAVDKLPPVKKFFMRHAMGVVGDLPKSMRGEAI